MQTLSLPLKWGLIGETVLHTHVCHRARLRWREGSESQTRAIGSMEGNRFLDHVMGDGVGQEGEGSDV